MDTCTPEFARLAHEVGGLECDANPFIELHNPFTLDSWTMPVIEATLIVGAIACLIHAVRWRTRTGDAAPLVVWFSGIFCLLLIEPVAYFPQWWGLENTMGLTFIHNQFSVQFLYGRLPLYIVAMYPAYGYISYVLIQRTGIFERRSILAGATCVALVFHCTYVFIDMVGPQWQWWVWNTRLASSKPAFGSSPFLNNQAFTLALPFAMALLAQWTKKFSSRGVKGVVGSVAVIAVGVWPIIFVTDVPWIVPDLLGMSTVDARTVGVWFLIVVVTAVAGHALWAAYRARRTDPTFADRASAGDTFALKAVCVYLLVGSVIWAAALPGYLDAVDGITPGGGQTGSLTYAAIMLTASIVAVYGCYAGTVVSRPLGKVGTTAPLPRSS